MHLGQHGGASVELITDCETATADEYRDLYTELTGQGYNLQLIYDIGTQIKSFTSGATLTIESVDYVNGFYVCENNTAVKFDNCQRY